MGEPVVFGTARRAEGESAHEGLGPTLHKRGSIDGGCIRVASGVPYALLRGITIAKRRTHTGATWHDFPTMADVPPVPAAGDGVRLLPY
ncbi:hypothetical protein ACFXJ8_42520 [Nonomuraea sp. NPDC059194]|uniref:hypothetical protein n=1 Tax=Nonomuraea sp. NPDC059194 TaxID=3346764 RepID=UPI003697386E